MFFELGLLLCLAVSWFVCTQCHFEGLLKLVVQYRSSPFGQPMVPFMAADNRAFARIAPPFQSQKPGSWIVPRTHSYDRNLERKQRNRCSMEGLEPRGSCTVDPDVFGRVLDVKEPCECGRICRSGSAQDGEVRCGVVWAIGVLCVSCCRRNPVT